MPNPVSETDYLRAVGQAAHNLAIIEVIQMNALRVVSGLSLIQAEAIFYGLESAMARKNVAQRLAKKNGRDPEILESVEGLFQASRVAGKARNELAHSFIKLGLDGSITRMYLRDHSRPEHQITQGYILSKVTATGDGLLDCQMKYEQLCKLLSIEPEVHY